MLLDYGLSEHLLAELCSRWNPALDEVVKSQGKYEKMKSNIEVLIRNNGEIEIVVSKTMRKPTINDVLSVAYATGTERKKNCIPPPP